MRKIFLAAVIFIAGFSIGAIGFSVLPHAKAQNRAESADEGFKMENAVINVANTAGKAVVSISTEYTPKFNTGIQRYYSVNPFGSSPFGGDDLLQRFFDDFFGQMPEQEYKQVGLGSGVIIDPEGYILTNDHVVRQADKITVKLSDGREFRGEVRGRDQRADLAVIKIKANNLPVALLGDSSNLKIGQWTVAIGNPFGFALTNPEPTVTVGVISALHRSLGTSIARDRDFNDLIQTDAAINPGNSGGPLVNLRGEVIGINVAIFTTTGGYEGIGFAIPINNAKRIISRLIEGKQIRYGWLGVTVQDLNDDLARYFGVSDKNGVLVANALAGGPADKAGIKEGDIIKEFDKKPVNNVRELLNLVAKVEVGRKVKVVFIRNRNEETVDVLITERQQNKEEKAAFRSETTKGTKWQGLSVSDLDSTQTKNLNIEGKSGVIVTAVEPSSPADAAGMISGDVIIEINKQPINDLSDYQKITQGLKGNVLIRTTRGYFLIKGEE